VLCYNCNCAAHRYPADEVRAAIEREHARIRG
jgi:hypothetical protein